MIKIFITLMAVVTLSLAAKGGGCELSQYGEVKVGYSAYDVAKKTKVSGFFKDVKYTAIVPMGKNFKTLFIGSSLDITAKNKKIAVKFLDITSDKRVRGKPRTGTMTLEVKIGSQMQKLHMTYSYLEGVMDATGKLTDTLEYTNIQVKLNLTIKALLCHAK